MDGDASDSDDGRAINFKRGHAEGRFRWKVKPEPFAQNFPEATYIENWEEFERKARDELRDKIRAATFRPIAGENSDEVEFAEFSFQDSPVRCERFLLVDQDAKSPRKPFHKSQIVSRWMDKLEDFDRENPCPPQKAIQYTMAETYSYEYQKRKAKWEKTRKGAKPNEFKDNSEPKKHYIAALEDLYAKEQPAWSAIVGQFDAASANTGLQKGDPEVGTVGSVLKTIIDKKWSVWDDADLTYLRKLNDHLVDTAGLLRVVPSSLIYIALDRNGKILIYLDPIAVQRTFGNETKLRMERDTKDLYDLKPPTRAKNVRTTSQSKNEERNGFQPDQCGVDHLGHWVSVLSAGSHDPTFSNSQGIYFTCA
ncbi:MAG: hypothetical protein Q9208_006238 [Pyrenodesmia sp. 3 TL-2023]